MSAKVVVVDARVDVEIGSVGPQGARGSQLLSGDIDPSPVIGLIGDQYLNTATLELFGPKTTSGWGEGVSLFDPNFVGQTYNQTSPSTVWNVVHTLNFVPNIIIVDSDGNVVEGDYQYITDNHIVATFSSPISGKAYLS